MRATHGVVLLGVLWILACSGGENTTDTPTDAPTDAPEVPEEVVKDLRLLWLAELSEGECALYQKAADGTDTAIANLGAPCPADWLLAFEPDSSNIALHSPDMTWIFDKTTARAVLPPADGIDMVAIQEGAVFGCADLEVEPTVKGDTLTWTYEGKTYTAKDDQGIGGVLAKTFTLGAEGWTLKSIAARALFEGNSQPFCVFTDESWPKAGKQLSAASDPNDDELREATEPEIELLKAFQEGGWRVSKQGGLAVPSEWLEGWMYGRPVVTRAADGAPFAVVPELKDHESPAAFDVSGPFLLINQESGALIRDIRSGKDVWTSPARAIVLHEGVSLPELAGKDVKPEVPAPAEAPPTEQPKPDPVAGGGDPTSPKPATPKPGGGRFEHLTPEQKAKLRAKMKAKAKAKAGQ